MVVQQLFHVTVKDLHDVRENWSHYVVANNIMRACEMSYERIKGFSGLSVEDVRQVGAVLVDGS